MKTLKVIAQCVATLLNFFALKKDKIKRTMRSLLVFCILLLQGCGSGSDTTPEKDHDTIENNLSDADDEEHNTNKGENTSQEGDTNKKGTLSNEELQRVDEFLKKNGFKDINSSSKHYANVLIAANELCHNKEEWRLFELLCKHPDVQLQTQLEAKNRNSETVLHKAIEYQHIEFIKVLLKYGANPDVQNHQGQTALHIAAGENMGKASMEILEVLLQEGADSTIEDENKKTALELLGNGEDEILRRIPEVNQELRRLLKIRLQLAGGKT
mmetsp:Transcript_10369/g.24009  ORF Transcript_10369/g.24009 Transcript_10369/m.24009 type:complete len:270 (+) Transcript_10369:2386-3195(+)